MHAHTPQNSHIRNEGKIKLFQDEAHWFKCNSAVQLWLLRRQAHKTLKLANMPDMLNRVCTGGKHTLEVEKNGWMEVRLFAVVIIKLFPHSGIQSDTLQINKD